MSSFWAELERSGFATGLVTYKDHYPGHNTDARIVLPITIAGMLTTPAILDTGAPWCVLDPELLAELRPTLDLQETSPLFLRGVRYTGQLVRVPLRIPAERGNDLEVDATAFVPTLAEGDTWQSPNFIGLSGFLERIRFAIDPTASTLFFGPA